MEKESSLLKKIIFTAVSIFLIVGYGVFVFAAAPNGGYVPGSTLDPDCAPGDTDCVVTIPAPWTTSGNDIFNSNSGNVGVGTSTPAATLDVAGLIQGNNLNIIGETTTISAPSSVSTSIDYNPAGGYTASSLAHNYRIYSYKDTLQGRIYSSTYRTVSAPVGSAPAAPTNLIATQTCVDGCSYTANNLEHNWRVYSYKNVGDQRIYSTTYAELPVSFVDDGSNNPYDISISWDAATGVDGYRVLKYDPNWNGYNYDVGYDTVATAMVDDGCGNNCFNSYNANVITTADIVDDNSGNAYNIIVSWSAVTGADGYRILKYEPANNGYNYDAGYDTTNTSITDDGCISVCFSGGSSSIGQTSIYSNVATINGQLTLTGPIVMQGLPIRLDQNHNFGVIADISQVTGSHNFFLGDLAGDTVTAVDNVNFIGQHAGQNATGANYANFFGQYAGYGATNAQYSNFLGQNAGNGATGAYSSNFLGSNTGYGATSASYSNFFGDQTGYGATNAYNSNFMGESAGSGAINADHANFFGAQAGYGATDAYSSNFFGEQAGYQATSASNANFFGPGAGSGADNAHTSNFFGNNAGRDASNAYSSNFLGVSAGQGATGAYYSNFLGAYSGYLASNAYYANFSGYNAGRLATNASYGNFMGAYAGDGATNAANANFFGQNAGYGATGSYNANFFGLNAGQGATGAWGANFLGENAGYGATGAYLANFLGKFAGQGATAARVSNFIGYGSGYLSVNAQQSNFLGWSAGGEAPNASFSNFMGREAGFSADNASGSNFLGSYAGRFADNASGSNFFGNRAGHGASGASNANFIGANAGDGAANAASSIFIGYYAGLNASNASNSIFIGQSAGNTDSVNNTGDINDFSILIGKSTSTGGYSNSIAIGGSATNTASNQFMIGSTTRPITSMVLVGDYSGGSCTFAVGGMSCSSDEQLKTNIEDLSINTLANVISVRTVLYNWNNNPTGEKQIGFLAQDLQHYFPQLVSVGQGGYLQVNYAQMTPILVEAIREMNLNITMIADMSRPNTWRDSFIAWFGNIENGITELFVGKLRAHELCLDDVCVTKDQLQQMMQQNNMQTIITSPADTSTGTDSAGGEPASVSTDTLTDTSTISDPITPTENTEPTTAAPDVSTEQPSA